MINNRRRAGQTATNVLQTPLLYTANRPSENDVEQRIARPKLAADKTSQLRFVAKEKVTVISSQEGITATHRPVQLEFPFCVNSPCRPIHPSHVARQIMHVPIPAPTWGEQPDLFEVISDDR